jgi:hypothetical protein
MQEVRSSLEAGDKIRVETKREQKNGVIWMERNKTEWNRIYKKGCVGQGMPEDRRKT